MLHSGDALSRHPVPWVCGRDARAPGANLRCARPSRGRFLGSPCVPSPLSGIRTPRLPLLPVWEKGVGGMRGKTGAHAGHPRSRRKPQVRAPFHGRVFWEALACHLPFQASGRPNSPFSPCGRRGLLTGVDFLASPCVPSPLSGIRTPNLPLLPVWVERGGI